MGLMTGIKANKAYRLQQKKQYDEAIKLYEEAFAEGLDEPRYNLAYALLIMRRGEYQKAKDFLVKHQKAPGMTPDQRVTLLVDYAACCFRLGNIDKGISTLEQQFRRGENGLLFQTLGYLYVEKYDAARRPASEDETESAVLPDEQAEEKEAESGDGDAAEKKEEALSPRQAWEAGLEKNARLKGKKAEAAARTLESGLEAMKVDMLKEIYHALCLCLGTPRRSSPGAATTARTNWSPPRPIRRSPSLKSLSARTSSTAT